MRPIKRFARTAKMLYITSKTNAMGHNPIKKYQITESKTSMVKEAALAYPFSSYSDEVPFVDREGRLALIRGGIPYTVIEVISERANIPVKTVLALIGIKQTTYNLNKRKGNLMDKSDTEMALAITELLAYGILVFNDEATKFHNWLQKVNRSLGGVTPLSLFDSFMGISDVRNALDRIHYGNLA